jgi:hypothetical protein
VEEKEEALDRLEDWLGNIDMAVNFHKIGGFPALKQCLASEHATLRYLQKAIASVIIFHTKFGGFFTQNWRISRPQTVEKSARKIPIADFFCFPIGCTQISG